MAPPLILLHGFTQTGASWDGVRAELATSAEVTAPDLRGHGACAASRPIDTQHLVADILALADGREFALAGYSMGGRLALQVALAAPAQVTALTLLSCTAGIEEEAERASRVAADEDLAATIEAQGIDAFANSWGEQPLFAGQPEHVRAAAHAQRSGQHPAGLAAALRGFGAGAMPSVWGELHTLGMPATVMAGERDEKYVVIGRRLVAALAKGRAVVVAGAGHALTLEAPQAVAGAITCSDP